MDQTPAQPTTPTPQMPELTPASPEQVAVSPKSTSRNKLLLAGLLIVILLVAVGLFFVSQKRASAPTPITSTQPSSQVAKQTLNLTLESPTENTLVSDDTLVVKGKTLPNTAVAFYTDSDDGSVQSDAEGNFQGTITLENGINTLTVTAYGEDDDEKSTTMDVVYDAEGSTQ